MIENIKCVTGAPSVQMQEVPPDFMCLESLEDQEDPDGRHDDESRSVKEPRGGEVQIRVGQEERVKEGRKILGVGERRRGEWTEGILKGACAEFLLFWVH